MAKNKKSYTLDYKTAPTYKSYKKRHDEKISDEKIPDQKMIKETDFDHLSKNDCYYCGKPGPNGIDRIDNNNGYELSNCLPCCKHCNYVKGALSVNDLKIWSKRFIDHQNLTGSIQLL